MFSSFMNAVLGSLLCRSLTVYKYRKSSSVQALNCSVVSWTTWNPLSYSREWIPRVITVVHVYHEPWNHIIYQHLNYLTDMHKTFKKYSSIHFTLHICLSVMFLQQNFYFQSSIKCGCHLSCPENKVNLIQPFSFIE